MEPLAEPIKRALLPLWNVGHRVAWRLGEYGDALLRRRIEWCDVCGRRRPMLYRRWVVPARLEELWGLSPELAEALARRESSECCACRAKLRARRLARVILELFPAGTGGPASRSLRGWAGTSRARSMNIAEINEIEGIHRILSVLPGLAYSEYREDASPGAIVHGVRHEDLMRLTYPDESFDLVLTSETLEHVPDLDAALGEIRRVLRPGGWHLFTVPLLPGIERTFARARRLPDGTVMNLATPISHPGGDWGYPVFTEFGADLPEVLRAAGYDEITIHFGPPRAEDLAQVIACRRPV